MEETRIPETPETDAREQTTPEGEPRILDEIEVEELAIDGICGVY